MQKHASNITKRYETFFSPIPINISENLHYDKIPVSLPYAEDFPRLHYHDKYEIGICEEGEGLFFSEGTFYPISKGDVVFVSPGCRHYSRSFHASDLCYCSFVYLSSKMVHGVLSIVRDHEERVITEHANRIQTVLRASEHPQAVSMLVELVKRCREENYREELAALRLATFLLEMKQLFRDEKNRAERQGVRLCAACAEADRIAEYFSLHYFESKSSKELAEMCHLSESQLRRQFLHAYGTSPIAYRNSLRCQIAAELLIRSDLTVSKISEQVGYSSFSDFYRQFQKKFGVSPSDYRKKI